MYAATWRRLARRPAEATRFPGSTFAALACVSVIEHGVDKDEFFAEAARLLRPGGVLFVSTDYWPQKIDVGASKLFEQSRGFDEIFSLEEIHSLVIKAADHGLYLLEELDLGADDRMIRDGRAAYTFLALAFTLEPDPGRGAASVALSNQGSPPG
jgi:SAM-dependent methyltransferase